MAETRRHLYEKRVVRLPDGRELVYYDQRPNEPAAAERGSPVAASAPPPKEA